VFTDYVYPAFVTLLADSSCLLFLFRKCLFVVVVVLFSLYSLPPYVFRFYLWLIGTVLLPETPPNMVTLHSVSVTDFARSALVHKNEGTHY